MKKFTLVEIMIVVAIIAVLSAIAIPNFTAYRESARNKVRTDYIEMVTVAKEQYKMDSGKSDGTAVTFENISSYMPSVDSLSELSVGGEDITIGALGESPSYPSYSE